MTPWTIQSVEFSRPEYWSGQPFPSPGDLPNPGIEPRSPTLQEDSLPAEPQGKPLNHLRPIRKTLEPLKQWNRLWLTSFLDVPSYACPTEFLFGDVITFTDSVPFCHYLGGDLHCQLCKESKKKSQMSIIGSFQAASSYGRTGVLQGVLLRRSLRAAVADALFSGSWDVNVEAVHLAGRFSR